MARRALTEVVAESVRHTSGAVGSLLHQYWQRDLAQSAARRLDEYCQTLAVCQTARFDTAAFLTSMGCLVAVGY